MLTMANAHEMRLVREEVALPFPNGDEPRARSFARGVMFALPVSIVLWILIFLIL